MGEILTPFEIRERLIETGTLQNDNAQGHIGPLPNIRNAIDALKPPIIEIKSLRI